MPDSPGDTGTYFSLKNFMAEEAARLTREGTTLEKSIKKDAVTENATRSDVDWVTELRAFSDCDLNKPAWRGRYTVDSTHARETLTVIYSTSDPKLPVKEMLIISSKERITELIIRIKKQNSYFRLEQELKYKSSIGYEISGYQKMILADPSSYVIKTNFIASTLVN